MIKFTYSLLHLPLFFTFLAQGCDNIKKQESIPSQEMLLGKNLLTILNQNITPTLSSTQINAPNLIKLLKENGGYIKFHKNNKLSPLHLAAITGDWNKINLLLNQGADPSAKESTGKTPLMCATLCGNLKATKILFKKTVLSIQDKISLLVAAATASSSDLINFFTENGIDSAAAIIQASKLPHYKELDFLFSNSGFKTDLCTSDGSSLLAVAIENSSEEVFYYLLSRKYPLNTKDHKGRTPLHIAALKHYKEFARILIINGVDRYAKDTQGKTPIDYDSGLKDLYSLS